MAKIKNIQSWPLGIGIIYGIFFAALLIFLAFSIFIKDDLVSNDYYSKELLHQKQIDRIQNSKKSGYNLNWYLDTETGCLVIEFPNNLEFSEIGGFVTFFRPSDKDLDRHIPIQVNSEGKQYIQTENFIAGNWRLKILWNNTQGEYYQEVQITLPIQGAYENRGK